MDELHGFLCDGSGPGGTRLVFAGLASGAVRLNRPRIEAELPALFDGGGTDGYLLDVRLSAMLREYVPKGTVAAGAFAQLPGVGDGGGVIGDPFEAPSSAAGYLDPLPHELWCVAYPGACGAVMQTGASTALEVAQRLQGWVPDSEAKLTGLLAALKKQTRAFLFIADGCGAPGLGCAAVCDGKNSWACYGQKELPYAGRSAGENRSQWHWNYSKEESLEWKKW